MKAELGKKKAEKCLQEKSKKISNTWAVYWWHMAKAEGKEKEHKQLLNKWGV